MKNLMEKYGCAECEATEKAAKNLKSINELGEKIASELEKVVAEIHRKEHDRMADLIGKGIGSKEGITHNRAKGNR